MPTYMGEEEVIKKNMALAQEQVYTVEYMEALPEDVRAELIDGRLYYMAAPTRTHQRLIVFLILSIGVYLKEKNCGCQVYPAPLALYLDEDDYTYLEPDLMVVCDNSKMDEKGCHGAPDLIAEIVSPSTRSRDYLLKLNKYQSAGVREYWILDMEKDVILIYDFEHEKVFSYGWEDKVGSIGFEDLVIAFSGFAR